MHINTLTSFITSLPIQVREITASAASLAQRVNKVACSVFSSLSRHAKGANLFGHSVEKSLKVASEIHPAYEKNLGGTLSAFGFVGIFTLIDLPQLTLHSFTEMKSSIGLGDIKGVALNSLEASDVLGHGLDASIGLTFTAQSVMSHFHYAFAIPKVLSKMLLPLGMALASAEMVLDGIKIYKTCKLLRDVNKKAPIELAAPIEKHGIIQNTSEKVFEAIKSKTHSDEVTAYLQRKLNVLMAHESINLVTLVALVILFVGCPYAGVALLALAAISKLGLYLKENEYLYKKSPDLV